MVCTAAGTIRTAGGTVCTSAGTIRAAGDTIHARGCHNLRGAAAVCVAGTTICVAADTICAEALPEERGSGRAGEAHRAGRGHGGHDARQAPVKHRVVPTRPPRGLRALEGTARIGAHTQGSQCSRRRRRGPSRGSPLDAKGAMTAAVFSGAACPSQASGQYAPSEPWCATP